MQSSKGFRMHIPPQVCPAMPGLLFPSPNATNRPGVPPLQLLERGTGGEVKQRSHKAKRKLDPGLRRGDGREVPHA